MMIYNLPDDLIEEILVRVPATSLRRLRSTCKQWNTLFNDNRFTKKHFDKAPKEFQVLIQKKYTVYLVNVNLSGIHNNIDPSIEVKGKTGKHYYNGLFFFITQIFHCDGLLLCTTLSNGYGLMVYNPIMGQTRWIKPRTVYETLDMYVLGYKNNKSCCDNYKILRSCWGSYNNWVKDAAFEIYEFKCNTWKVLDYMSPHLEFSMADFGVSLKGNTYWPTSCKKESVHGLLIRFDFTGERFEHLRLPFTPSRCDNVALSTIREEQLVVLYQKKNTLEIWVTNKIDETKNVLWSMFLTVDLDLKKFVSFIHSLSFMVDEKNKVVMCCGIHMVDDIRSSRFYIFGEHEFKQVDHHRLGDYANEAIRWNLLSYVPSLVQIL